mmetsp:Transcript_9687/g.19761  ORF Transcript_9687/g.19761 Transcript_9687/m.19761 type:complete len:200 (+) Transcript_9687:81-680(+)
MSSSSWLRLRRSSSVRTRLDLCRLSCRSGLPVLPDLYPAELGRAEAGHIESLFPASACALWGRSHDSCVGITSSAFFTASTHAFAIDGFELRKNTLRLAVVSVHAPSTPSLTEQTSFSSGSAFTIFSQSAPRKMSKLLRPRMIHRRAQSPPLPPFSTNPLRKLGGGKLKSSGGAGLPAAIARRIEVYCTHCAGVSTANR